MSSSDNKTNRKKVVIITCAVLVALVAGFAVWYFNRPRIDSTIPQTYEMVVVSTDDESVTFQLKSDNYDQRNGKRDQKLSEETFTAIKSEYTYKCDVNLLKLKVGDKVKIMDGSYDDNNKINPAELIEL